MAPTKDEKISNLMITGYNRRPPGSRARICIYIDKRLLQNASVYKICELGSRTDNPPPLSRWVEAQLGDAIAGAQLASGSMVNPLDKF